MQPRPASPALRKAHVQGSPIAVVLDEVVVYLVYNFFPCKWTIKMNEALPDEVVHEAVGVEHMVGNLIVMWQGIMCQCSFHPCFSVCPGSI